MQKVEVVFFAVIILCCISFTSLSVKAGNWKTAVVVTTDKVHEKQASVEQNGNTFIIKAGGDDIWGNADQFTFVYQEISGDFEMSVTVHSLDETNEWSKSGIMARQDLEPESPNVLAAVRGKANHGHDLVTFQNRPTRNAASASERLTATKGEIPVSIKLIRKGDEFTGTYSLKYVDENSWVPFDELDGKNGGPPAPWVVPMEDPILLGIAVTSHQAGVITTSEVEIINVPGSFPVEPLDKTAITWAEIKSSY